MATTPSSSPQMTNSQISSKGILVKLNISQWTANRKDNDVTTATNANFGASKDAGHYQKFLVSKSSLRDVNRAASKARKFHYERTLPWGDDGERILAADMVMDYTRGMRDCRHEFDFAVREFVNKYPGLIIDSQQSLGKMFNSAEYPTTSEVLNRFKLDTHMRPVPISDDFRIKITEAEASRIKAKLDAENQTLIKDAMQDVWDRLYNSVKMMADRLGEKDKSFKRSTVENVATLCDLLPKLNIADDPNLETMRQEVMDKLCQHTPDQIRGDATLREDTAREADALVNKMGSLMGNTV